METIARFLNTTVTPMCEILLCVKDRGTSGVLLIDSHAPKQGDVVCVSPDGFQWGAAELGQVIDGNPNGNHPFFRVIKLPNVTILQASNLLFREVDVDPQNPSPYLQHRARYLDRTKINPATQAALKSYWDDDARAAGFITLPYTAAQINNIVSVRTPISF